MTQVTSLPLRLMTKQHAACLSSQDRNCNPTWYETYCITNYSHWEWQKGILNSSELRYWIILNELRYWDIEYSEILGEKQRL